MSDNFDKSNINEAEKSKSNDSEQSLEDAAEGSDEALQKKIKSGSPSTQRVQRPHCKQIWLCLEAILSLFLGNIFIRLPCTCGPELGSSNCDNIASNYHLRIATVSHLAA